MRAGPRCRSSRICAARRMDTVRIRRSCICSGESTGTTDERISRRRSSARGGRRVIELPLVFVRPSPSALEARGARVRGAIGLLPPKRRSRPQSRRARARGHRARTESSPVPNPFRKGRSELFPGLRVPPPRVRGPRFARKPPGRRRDYDRALFARGSASGWR